MLYSGKEKDRCGICNGNGDSCTLVQSSYTENYMTGKFFCLGPLFFIFFYVYHSDFLFIFIVVVIVVVFFQLYRAISCLSRRGNLVAVSRKPGNFSGP